MNLFFLFSTYIYLVTWCILYLSYILQTKNITKEKTITYECGFNPIYLVGSPFSIKFFIIGVLFLIFDIEIILLIPWSIGSLLINKNYIYIFNYIRFNLIVIQRWIRMRINIIQLEYNFLFIYTYSPSYFNNISYFSWNKNIRL